MKNNCGKLCALVVGSALAVSTINASVFAETIEPEVISVIGSRMSVLKDMAVSPTGSYSSYTSSKNTSISNYNSAYAELKAVFPGI